MPIDKIIAELNDFMPEQVISYPGVFLSLIKHKKWFLKKLILKNNSIRRSTY